MLELLDGKKRVEHVIEGVTFVLKPPCQSTRMRFTSATRVGVKLGEKYLDDFSKDEEKFKVKPEMIEVDFGKINYLTLNTCLAESIVEIKGLPEKYKDLKHIDIVEGLQTKDYWSLVGAVRKLLTLSEDQKKSSKS